MSALVDIWTNELAKLRNNNDDNGTGGSQTLWSSLNNNHAAVHADGERRSPATASASAGLVDRFAMKKKKLHCSEASLSMLVHCFSP